MEDNVDLPADAIVFPESFQQMLKQKGVEGKPKYAAAIFLADTGDVDRYLIGVYYDPTLDQNTKRADVPNLYEVVRGMLDGPEDHDPKEDEAEMQRAMANFKEAFAPLDKKKYN